ncbi:hypothetical protein CXB51_034416 [Gossypium anomalum]|uniref:Secreted protein n=1 Tax=Gossypium anomalum TaxID=47600 RepID=A0A8J6CLX6_9ROSI|nr:hypothetical protein CXB51_034416 [Gossypium anomalum]
MLFVRVLLQLLDGGWVPVLKASRCYFSCFSVFVRSKIFVVSSMVDFGQSRWLRASDLLQCLLVGD